MGIGFAGSTKIIEETLNYSSLQYVYNTVPGLVSDKLKYLLEFIWEQLKLESIDTPRH